MIHVFLTATLMESLAPTYTSLEGVREEKQAQSIEIKYHLDGKAILRRLLFRLGNFFLEIDKRCQRDRILKFDGVQFFPNNSSGRDTSHLSFKC